MANMRVKECRIRDVVRDSKILRDCFYEKFDVFAMESSRDYCQDAGRVFPRTQFGEINKGIERRAKSFEEIFSSQHRFYGKRFESEVYREFKATVPSFNGAIGKNPVLDWIDAVDDYFDQRNPPEDLKCNLAATKLKGEAHTWWEELQKHRFSKGKEMVSSWFKMSELLFLRFSPANCSKNYLNKKPCEKSVYDGSIVSYNNVPDYSIELTQAAKKEKKSTERCDVEDTPGKNPVGEQPKERVLGKSAKCSMKVPSHFSNNKHDDSRGFDSKDEFHYLSPITDDTYKTYAWEDMIRLDVVIDNKEKEDGKANKESDKAVGQETCKEDVINDIDNLILPSREIPFELSISKGSKVGKTKLKPECPVLKVRQEPAMDIEAYQLGPAQNYRLRGCLSRIIVCVEPGWDTVCTKKHTSQFSLLQLLCGAYSEMYVLSFDPGGRQDVSRLHSSIMCCATFTIRLGEMNSNVNTQARQRSCEGEDKKKSEQTFGEEADFFIGKEAFYAESLKLKDHHLSELLETEMVAYTVRTGELQGGSDFENMKLKHEHQVASRIHRQPFNGFSMLLDQLKRLVKLTYKLNNLTSKHILDLWNNNLRLRRLWLIGFRVAKRIMSNITLTRIWICLFCDECMLSNYPIRDAVTRVFDPGGVPYIAITGNFGNYLSFSCGLLLNYSNLKIDMETTVLSVRSISIVKANGDWSSPIMIKDNIAKRNVLFLCLCLGNSFSLFDNGKGLHNITLDDLQLNINHGKLQQNNEDLKKFFKGLDSSLIHGLLLDGSDFVEALLTGKWGYATLVQPHISIYSMVAAFNIILSLQYPVSWEIDPFYSQIVTVAELQRSVTSAVILDSLTVECTFRAFSNESLVRLRQQMVETILERVYVHTCFVQENAEILAGMINFLPEANTYKGPDGYQH